MTKGDVQLLASTLAPIIREHVDAALAPLRTKIAELEGRPIGAIYRDVWDATTKYEPHEMVSHDGSCWIAKTASIGTRPGTAPGVWRLCVKRGRDARDVK